MIDLHTHFLPGADDCVQTEDESIAILKQAETIGMTDIVLTVCYIPHLNLVKTVAENTRVFKALKQRCAREKVNVRLHLGNEILFDNDLVQQTERGLFKPLGDSRVLLTETPENTKLLEVLKDKGYCPMLANPERYAFADRDYLNAVRAMGVLTQGSLQSIGGVYGEAARQQFITLLEADQFDCLASGARDGKPYESFDLYRSAITAIIGEDKWTALTETTPAQILNSHCW